jgi:hypothetical protein
VADDQIKVEAVNGPAFLAALARMRADLADPKDALETAARTLTPTAQANAPHVSGRLAGAHRVLPPSAKKVRITVDVPYAAPIHWGWPAHGISRQEWLVATWKRDPAPLEKMSATVQAGIDKAAAAT